jgi:2-keto-4-pentenoate hydratase
MGERLRAGDRLITGSVVQVPIARGDEVIADIGPLGRVKLTTAP